MKTKKILSLLLASIMLLGLITVPTTAADTSTDTYALDEATELLAAPTINGTVSEEEWGNPVVVTNNKHANGMWDSGHVLSDAANYNPEQRAKVWLTNDNEFIYVAATLDHEDQGDSWTTNDRNHPRFEILLSQKGEGNGPVLVAGKDQYTKLSIGFKENGVQSLRERTYANIDSASMDHSAFSYSAKFENSTYTYELKIPFAMTNINLKESEDIAVSILICAANHDGANNKYNIGGTGCLNANTNKTNAQNQCLIMALNDVQNPKAAIGDIKYPTLEAALDAATSGQTVTLLANAEMDQWTDTAGITLDLNGNILSAKTVSAILPFSKIIDSQDGQGGIQIAKNSDNAKSLQISANSNEYLPLYDASMNNNAGGYRFFKCTLVHKQGETTYNGAFGYRFGYQMDMSDEAFKLLVDANGDDVLDADIQLSYNIKIEVNGDEKDTLERYFKTSILTEYGTKEQVDATKLNYAATLKVTGFDAITDQTVTITSSAPQIVSSTGVLISASDATLTYTYPNQA